MTDDDPHTDDNGETGGETYDALRTLPVTVEKSTVEGLHVASDRGALERTVVKLHGAGHTGVGEDVTWDGAAHEPLRAEGLTVPTGEQTIASFADGFDATAQLPTGTGGEQVDNSARRWAVESAALDLALKQRGESLGSVLGREYAPLSFVTSLSLDTHDAMDTVRRLRAAVPGLEFKVDVPADPDDALFADLADTGAVRILDLKGHYGPDTGAPVEPALYRRIFETFPDAIVEDPVVTPETRPVLAEYAERVSWDAPLKSADSLGDLPWEPAVSNVKPSRFGGLASVCAFLDRALAAEMALYGGGMFELDAGRGHSQALASLFYPDGPNDLAPTVYHRSVDDLLGEGVALPTSPLDPPANPTGIGWA